MKKKLWINIMMCCAVFVFLLMATLSVDALYPSITKYRGKDLYCLDVTGKAQKDSRVTVSYEGAKDIYGKTSQTCTANSKGFFCIIYNNENVKPGKTVTINASTKKNIMMNFLFIVHFSIK